MKRTKRNTRWRENMLRGSIINNDIKKTVKTIKWI